MINMQRNATKIDKMQVGAWFLLCALLGMGIPLCDAAGVETAASPSLSEIVFFGLRPAKELDLSHYRKEGRVCVKAYLDKISPESPLWSGHAPSTPEEAVTVRRRNLKEQMVILLGEKVQREAKAFSAAVPLIAEWEGMSEGPVDEANFADQWLRKYPETPIAAFLHLFKSHRLRAGFEAARAGHEKGLWPILATRYREVLAWARSSDNPLIVCIANDLEAQSHVYLEGQGRP
jgi:hypothetical protein